MASSRAAEIPVLYATNRAKLPVGGTFSRLENALAWGKQDTDLYADGKIGATLILGTCKVPVPDGRVRGSSVSGQPQAVNEGDWTDAIKGKEILVIVHGFNNTFNDAVQAAARLKKDMPWHDQIISFSWASWGHTEKYIADEVIQNKSVGAFIQLLEQLQAAAAIHILAHSMGNRILLEALSSFDHSAPSGTLPLGQLIFAAADEDAETFKMELLKFSTTGLGRTMYLSSQDPALAASAVIHSGNRAGQAWPPETLVPYKLRRPFVLAKSLVSIDCSDAGLEYIIQNGFGYDPHGYYAQPPALDDIRQVLAGVSVDGRLAPNENAPGLTKVTPENNDLLDALAKVNDAPTPDIPPGVIWWRLNPSLAASAAVVRPVASS